MEQARHDSAQTGETAHHDDSLFYAAATWSAAVRIVVKAEVVRAADKELHDGLSIDRTSCSRFAANQARVLLTAAACVLMQEIRLKAARCSRRRWPRRSGWPRGRARRPAR